MFNFLDLIAGLVLRLLVAGRTFCATVFSTGQTNSNATYEPVQKHIEMLAARWKTVQKA
jgi:hypothetical protein